MRELVHNFLKWLPAAIGAGAVGVATAWPHARDWIGAKAGLLWGAMSNPFVTAAVMLAVIAYAGAIIWTSKPRQSTASTGVPALPPEAYREQYERRQMMIGMGRGLVREYTTQTRERNFRRFLEKQPEYAIIRPHFSRAYLAMHSRRNLAHASDDGGRSAALVQAFLNEIDRIEREWGLS